MLVLFGFVMLFMMMMMIIRPAVLLMVIMTILMVSRIIMHVITIPSMVMPKIVMMITPRPANHNPLHWSLHQVQPDTCCQKQQQRTILHNPGIHPHPQHQHHIHILLKYPKLDTSISVSPSSFVTLRGPPLGFETGWTGELWSKTYLLNCQN